MCAHADYISLVAAQLKSDVEAKRDVVQALSSRDDGLMFANIYKCLGILLSLKSSFGSA